MNEIKFMSDSSVAKISVEDGRIKISKGKSETISFEKNEITEIRICKRVKQFTPDLFFIGYALFTEIIGIGALYFLFKITKGEYFYYGASVFLIASIFYFFEIIKAANNRKALFIKDDEKISEIPINKTSDINRVILFFSENGISVQREF